MRSCPNSHRSDPIVASVGVYVEIVHGYILAHRAVFVNSYNTKTTFIHGRGFCGLRVKIGATMAYERRVGTIVALAVLFVEFHQESQHGDRAEFDTQWC